MLERSGLKLATSSLRLYLIKLGWICHFTLAQMEERSVSETPFGGWEPRRSHCHKEDAAVTVPVQSTGPVS